jgi:hypothetical protein
MAIGKWMPFGTPQSSSTAQAQKPQEVAVISSANAKKFGLENVRVPPLLTFAC